METVLYILYIEELGNNGNKARAVV